MQGCAMEAVVVLISILVIVASVFSVQQKLFIKEQQFSDLFCAGNATIVLNDTNNLLKCAAQCDLERACHGFFFNTQTNDCKGVNPILTSNACGSQVSGSRYYKEDINIGTNCTDDIDCPVKDTICFNGVCECRPTLIPNSGDTMCVNGTTNFGAACVNSSDCYGANMTCYQGMCMCDRGLYRNSRTQTCHNSCTTFGSTFTHYNGSSLVLVTPNETEWLNHTLQECFTKCFSTGCSNMRHVPSLVKCKTDATTLVGSTPVDVSQVTLYIRDCVLQ